jgi:predicted Rossmann fold flavoprotein
MKYDVVVIGGGPAGMMAAGRAGQFGQAVLLLEKNKELGVKLLMTGKDRCNVTHYTEEVNELVDAYGKNGKFLYSGFSRFGNLEVMNFFENRGVKLKVERGQRVFPVSDNSRDIRKVLVNFLAENKVEVRTRQKVEGFIKYETENGEMKIKELVVNNGERVEAEKFIVATGGLSYPATGATGDGYDWARELGHSIIKPRPALSPIILSDWFVEDLEGLSLRNVELSIWNDNKKVETRFGEMLFAKRGISGPIVLDLSKYVDKLLEEKQINQEENERIDLKIDLKPALDFVKLDKRIQRDFQAGNNKQFKNILDKLLPKKLIPVVIKLTKINSEKQINLITREERHRLVRALKEFPLHGESLVGFDKAIITAGGVDLKEVNSKTMQSRLVSNLYFAGEVLDLDGPTGGYNLQVAWSTGYAAGGV